MEMIQERKQALKNRIEALNRDLQPHLRAVENLRERIDVLETDYRLLLDAATDAETQKRNEEAREKAKRAPKKEWVAQI